MTESLHPSSSEDHTSEQLAVLQALCAEVSVAYLALVNNELAAFQEHTSQLDELCVRLQRHRISTPGRDDAGRPTSIGPDGRILSVVSRLSKECYRLSALVRRRRRTVHVLSRHYQTVIHSACDGADGSPNLHTWSSEV